MAEVLCNALAFKSWKYFVEADDSDHKNISAHTHTHLCYMLNISLWSLGLFSFTCLNPKYTHTVANAILNFEMPEKRFEFQSFQILEG